MTKLEIALLRSNLSAANSQFALFLELVEDGKLIFIHHQCWEVLPFCRFQRQRCKKILCPKDSDFHTPLALKAAKGQHLPALVVYKNQSPRRVQKSVPTKIMERGS